MAPKSDHYGKIKDMPVGTTFKDRAALAKAGVHRPLRAGIAPDSHTKAGVYSVVLNGGYEDDEDQGNYITYTGQGKGSKAATQPQDHGAQEGDQSWDTPGNKALKRSTETGRVVRVIRGSRSNSKFSPEVGFRYDGLYCAMNPRRKIGKQGFKVCVVDLKGTPAFSPPSTLFDSDSASAGDLDSPTTSPCVRPSAPYPALPATANDDLESVLANFSKNADAAAGNPYLDVFATEIITASPLLQPGVFSGEQR
ncbi:Carboxymuconolactone decarboxylase [Mycena kentingensis (nom. inval.)]|nr:Carboxymuconolactone decarboxylase [Mycena kentingensis (nom. inval.)]